MYYLGKKSKKELQGVKEELIDVVDRAIQLTSQDFSVHDGLRTYEEQMSLVARGASKTIKSKHLEGKAVDLVPYLNGKLRWEWNLIYPITDAVRKAAQELNVDLRWGGAWDINLTQSEAPARALVHSYVEARRSLGRTAFIDGPHYELIT